MGFRDLARRLFATPPVLPPGGSGSTPDDYVPPPSTPGGTPGVGEVTGSVASGMGYTAAPSASLEVYRRMRACPSIAIARVAATTPIRATPWALDHDDGVSEEALAAAQEIIDVHRLAIVKHAIKALDYGFSAFEIEWDIRNGLVVPVRFVPLAVDVTEALVDPEDPTRLAGAKVGTDARLPAAKVLWFSYDSEAGSFYGRSRNENVRNEWAKWSQTVERLGNYIGQTSSSVPMIEYPEGVSKDGSGADIDNFELAKKVLVNLSAGRGVAMPNSLVAWAEEAIKRGVDVAKLKAWSIDFIERSAGFGGEYIQSLRYFDSLMARGWLVAERAVTEGQMGTKAEAEAHGDFVIRAAAEVTEDLTVAFNEQVLGPFLRMNWGKDAERAIQVVPSSTDPATLAWLRGLVASVLTNPTNLGLLLDMVELDGMLDTVGVQRRANASQDSARGLLTPETSEDLLRAARTMAGVAG